MGAFIYNSCHLVRLTKCAINATHEKQVCPLCALIISLPMRHASSSMLYPLNRLPHVSPNNVGHLEFKNLSTYLSLHTWSQVLKSEV
jgi:hypothetical protein